MNKILLQCNNISFKPNNVDVLKNINLKISSNSVTAIVGPNGSGKTSLLKILFGLYAYTKGSIQRNYDIRDSSFIFQHHIFLNMTVFEIFNHALFCKNIEKLERLEIINECIKKYNIESFKNKNIKVLSGGEKQIVALLRSIILKPKVLFYDEPLNNLDNASMNFIINILKKLYDDDVKLIIVTHDNDLLEKLNCETIRVLDGAVLND